MMKWFKFRQLEILLGILFLFAGFSPLTVDFNEYSTIICAISAILVWFYPLFIKRSIVFWLISILSFSATLFSLWSLPKVDLWYPIFHPLLEPLIFLFAFSIFLFKYFHFQKFNLRFLWGFLSITLIFFSLTLTFRDEHQASKKLKNIVEKAADANYGDPLLSIFDLAEELSNQNEFWNKYQQQEGWVSWLEEHYFKEKLTGFELIDFKDTVVSEIKVDMQEGYKTQIFQVLIPRNDSSGIWISLERKSTPALLFEETQQTGLTIQEGVTLGVYVDEMLQQSQGKALLSPFWKENLQDYKSNNQDLFEISKNGNRTTFATMPFSFGLVFWSKLVWSIFLVLFSYGFSNFQVFIQRWKSEKRFKIQWVILGMVFVSAFIFSAYSIRISQQQFHDEIFRSKLSEIEKFSAQLRQILFQSSISDPTTQVRLNRIGRIWEVDFRLTDANRKPVFQTFFFDQPIQLLERKNMHENWYELKNQKIRSIQYRLQLPEKTYFFEWFLFNEDLSQGQENRGKMLHFLGSIILFLFGFSWLVAKWLIQPFIVLKNQLISSGNETLIWNDQDEIGQLVTAYNDVLSKVKKQAQTLAEQEKEKAWKNMAKQVAHEIRNPLTPMKLQLQMLDRMPEGEKKQQQLSKTISILHEQMNSLERISTEFSSFANFPEPKMEHLDFIPVIQNAIDLYSTQAQIQFSHPQSVYMPLDAEMMMRAIGNLIKNAIQAYGDNSLDGEINVQLEANSNEIKLQLEDWAGGIPDEFQSKIFQPNFTTKSSGMGLGLSLIQRTIESHGGSIHFISKPNEGCIFNIRFPVGNGS